MLYVLLPDRYSRNPLSAKKMNVDEVEKRSPLLQNRLLEIYTKIKVSVGRHYNYKMLLTI